MSSLHNPLRLFLGCSLLASLTACPSKTPSRQVQTPTNATLNTVSEKIAACEKVIRGQMSARSLRLESVAGFEEDVGLANQLADGSNTTKYQVEKGKQVSSVEIDYYRSTATDFDGISYSLKLADPESKFILSLDVEGRKLRPDSYFDLTQTLNIDSDCHSSIAMTVKETLTKTGPKSYVDKKTTVYLDGQRSDDEPKAFELPDADLPFANLVPDDVLNDFTTMPEKSYGYLPGLGVVTLTSTAAKDLQMEELGAKFNLHGRNIAIAAEGKLILTMYFGSDASTGATVSGTQPLDSLTWIISREIWESALLGTVQDLNSAVTTQLAADYFGHSNSMRLLTNKAPSYDHIKAYWSIAALTQDATTGMETLSLVENSSGSMADQSTAADLESNDTIQTTLPEIASAASDILSKASNDRHRQIELILAYLGDHYIYDTSMVDNNIVRPLTTDEALKRHKGVCQHYAVIYTAIARALKIPTRIVVGYYIGDGKAGSHAWVESEVSPGTWRAIEPQATDSLTSMQTRNYYPTMRGTFLENKNQNLSDVYTFLVGLKLMFQPST